MAPSTIYLALGSNLGDRRALLAQGLAALAAAGVTVAAGSSVYETDAVADHPQPPYLNLVIRGETTLPPDALLQLCLQIERRLGRVRAPGGAKTSRTLDIDILLYDARVLSTDTLTIPHPALLDRPFVRIPLAEVAAQGLLHPVTRDPLDSATPSPAVRRAAAPLDPPSG
ncbi:MAG TPA: 2-amino-4-hydroxy-6-hydroxymethyldihydropteridine diphosphokinase [Polyangia bacterium]|jgi:2-amino-4-hydroxy-6-hydroxymethyldihydropteridine diphosphokinase|nr:2-amino-4-hydroxy-6-hydroxymethyldihydropteridine diphosphokinase [Polyangia bacterium]